MNQHNNDPMNLCLRPAVPEDCDLLYGWANDPAVRQWSFHTETIPYEDHIAWFDRMMSDDHIRQYILTAGGREAGQIRITVEADDPASAEVGYSVASACRGKGYGTALLRLAEDAVRRDLPQVRRLIARVKEGNAASWAMARTAGYRITDTVPGASYILCERLLP